MVARTSGRPFGALGRIGIVAGMHVAVVLLVANSLGFHPLTLPPKDIVTTFVDEPIRPPEPPPVVTPQQQTVENVIVPVPNDPDYERPSDAAITAQRVPTEQIPDAVPQPAATNLVSVQNDPRHPLTQPPYPPDAIRAGNEGSAIVEIYVLPNGHVGDARIVKSTGFDSLDHATIAEARRNWRMKPATKDGVPYPEWHRLSVVFRLENR